MSEKEEPKKVLIYMTEMLTNPSMGIYTQIYYYSDGSTETRQAPKGPIIIVEPISLWW